MIKKIIIGIILNALALYGVTYVLPEITYSGGVMFFAFGGLTMGLLNSFVKPILKLITFPLHLLTLGISLTLLNAIIFWIFEVIVGTIVVKGISLEVPAFKTYFLAGLAFGVINWVEHLVIHNK